MESIYIRSEPIIFCTIQLYMDQAILNIHLKLKRLVKTRKLNILEKDIDKRQANLSQNNPKALET